MSSFRKSIHTPEQALLRDWLTEKRHKLNFTQRDLAKKLDVVHSLVGKVEKGERRLDAIEFILYCDALEADPNDFYTLIKKKLKSKN